MDKTSAELGTIITSNSLEAWRAGKPMNLIASVVGGVNE